MDAQRSLSGRAPLFRIGTSVLIPRAVAAHRSLSPRLSGLVRLQARLRASESPAAAAAAAVAAAEAAAEERVRHLTAAADKRALALDEELRITNAVHAKRVADLEAALESARGDGGLAARVRCD
jgi:hypothetical protein